MAESLAEGIRRQQFDDPVDGSQDRRTGKIPLQLLLRCPAGIKQNQVKSSSGQQIPHFRNCFFNQFFPTVDRVDHQVATTTNSTNKFQQAVIKQVFIVENRQGLNPADIGTDAYGLCRHPSIHDHHAPFAGGAILGAGLYIFPGLGNNLGQGFLGRFHPFSPNPDKSNTHFFFAIILMGDPGQNGWTFNSHPENTAGLLGQHIFNYGKAVFNTEILAAEAINTGGNHRTERFSGPLIVGRVFHITQQVAFIGQGGLFHHRHYFGILDPPGKFFRAHRIKQYRTQQANGNPFGTIVVNRLLQGSGSRPQADNDIFRFRRVIIFHHIKGCSQQSIHHSHGGFDVFFSVQDGQVLFHLGRHGHPDIGKGTHEHRMVKIRLKQAIGFTKKVFQKSIGKHVDILNAVTFLKSFAGDNGRQHHLALFNGFKSQGNEIMQFLIISTHELQPAGPTGGIQIGMAVMDT